MHSMPGSSSCNQSMRERQMYTKVKILLQACTKPCHPGPADQGVKGRLYWQLYTWGNPKWSHLCP